MLKNSLLLHCGVAILATLGISWFQIRPYGIVFILMLVLWIFKTRCTTIKLIPPPEITAKFESGYNKLSQLRKDRPSVFCSFISAVLVALAIIGHIVSGSCIVVFGLIVAGLISTKYQFHIVKEQYRAPKTWSSQTTDHDVDEFLPEVNESNLFVLQHASTDALVIYPALQTNEEDEKNDEIPSELLIPDPIPEIEENSDGSSDDDLLLKNPLPAKTQAIEFKSGYFNKDSSISSSSSDDDSLSKGLNFDTVDNKEKHRLKSQAKHSNISTSQILPNLVTELFTRSLGITSSEKSTLSQDVHRNQQHQLDSSDESEFEILNTDDLNNS